MVASTHAWSNTKPKPRPDTRGESHRHHHLWVLNSNSLACLDLNSLITEVRTAASTSEDCWQWLAVNLTWVASSYKTQRGDSPVVEFVFFCNRQTKTVKETSRAGVEARQCIPYLACVRFHFQRRGQATSLEHQKLCNAIMALWTQQDRRASAWCGQGTELESSQDKVRFIGVPLPACFDLATPGIESIAQYMLFHWATPSHTPFCLWEDLLQQFHLVTSKYFNSILINLFVEDKNISSSRL